MAHLSTFVLFVVIATLIGINNAQDQDGTTTPSPRYVTCINNCQTTPQFSPVCGNDGVTYYNRAKLECAQLCGNSVIEARIGTCRPSAGGK